MNEGFDGRSAGKNIDVSDKWDSIAYPREEGADFIIECNGAFHRKLSYNPKTDEYTLVGETWACDAKEHNF